MPVIHRILRQPKRARVSHQVGGRQHCFTVLRFLDAPASTKEQILEVLLVSFAPSPSGSEVSGVLLLWGLKIPALFPCVSDWGCRAFLDWYGVLGTDNRPGASKLILYFLVENRPLACRWFTQQAADPSLEVWFWPLFASGRRIFCIHSLAFSFLVGVSCIEYPLWSAIIAHEAVALGRLFIWQLWSPPEELS